MSPHPAGVFWSEYTNYFVLKILHNSLQEDIHSFEVSSNFNLMFVFSILTNQSSSAELYLLFCSACAQPEESEESQI